MEILWSGEEEQEEALIARMKEAAELCLLREELQPDDWELSLSFVDLAEIRRLNREFREIDKETDVLSFPQYEDPAEALPLAIGEPLCLGDVVICREQAEKQAEEFGHSVDRELLYLFVHSVFHLLGYDHMEEEDKKEMRAAEEEIMEKLQLRRE